MKKTWQGINELINHCKRNHKAITALRDPNNNDKIGSLSNNKSHGSYSFPAQILKCFCDTISPILSDIINISIELVAYPSKLKMLTNYVIFRPYQKNVHNPPRIPIYDNETNKSVNLEQKDCIKHLGV